MRRLWLLPLLTSLLILAVPASTHADTNDFVVTNFTADYYLNRSDPQGSLDVTERIKVDFSGYNHGIFRVLPQTYKGTPLHVKILSVTSPTGAITSYKTHSSNGNKVLKIGDPNLTITGSQEYGIHYREDNVISFYGDHDELYWDINGDQWNQPFTHVQATFHLPAGLKLSSQQPHCYTGVFGSTAQSCDVRVVGSGVTTSADSLGADQTLTVVIGFQKGYFQPTSLRDRIGDYRGLILGFALPPLLAFGLGYIWWYRRGRDAKGRGTIVPEYDPPAGLSPLEAGTIVDFKVDNRDITATIIDLARRGYLRIVETTKVKKLRKDTTSYTLVLRNDDYTALNPYERKLMAGLFADKQVDDEVSVSSLKNKLYSVADDLRKSADTALTQEGYFKKDPQRYAFTGAVVLGVMLLLGHVFGGVALKDNLWPVLLGVLLAVVILGFFYHLLPARTALGVAAREQLLGLKMYMQTAEKDRLEKLEGPNAKYAANAGEPVRTVELFEKLLPYAIVLGVETQWAGKFEDIYRTPPDWYSGNWTAFNAGYLVGNLNSGFSGAINSSFSAPSSSGSSGFGGGGFSGGGGGGGGGGGW